MSPVDANAQRIVLEGFDARDERRREALFAMGNGVLSCRACAPEASATRERDAHYPGLYRAAWYDEAARKVNGRTVRVGALVNLPDPFGLSFSLDGEAWFDLSQAELRGYRQSFELAHGLCERQLHFVFAGHAFHLHETRFVSMADPGLAVVRWTLEASDPPPAIHVCSTLNGDVRNTLVVRNRAYEGRRLRPTRVSYGVDGTAALLARLEQSDRRVAVATQTRVEPQSHDWQAYEDDNRVTLKTRCAFPSHGQVSVEKRINVLVDDELPMQDDDACSTAQRRISHAPFERLCDDHQNAWNRLWARVSLHCEDHELETPLRFAVVHLLQAISPISVGRDQGFPPRGWHEGYFGQIFWDEIFAQPFLSTHFPELARATLEYRHRRLDTARTRARREGLQGALFPWRSARSGEEETPPFLYFPLSQRWVADHTHLQRHIGAAIVFDVWQLFVATGDPALLAGKGGELILEIARFWASVAEYDGSRERYVIRRVIGPDEYHNQYPEAARPGLDNNTYTNVMAVWSLCRALDVLALLSDEQSRAVRSGLRISQTELEHWEEISRRMYVPLLEGGVLNQFEGYEKLLPAPSQWLHDDRPRLDWMLEARNDSCERYQLTKQADVLMLLHLFPTPELRELLNRLGYAVDEDALARTVDYHLARITHESSLSKMVCAGALAHFNPELSWQYFRECLRTDLGAPSEGGVIEGVHLGAMAGSLDVLQRHYLGLRPALDGLHVWPAPPAGLGDISFAFDFRGARLNVMLSAQRLRLSLEAGPDQGIPVVHVEGTRQLHVGESLELPCRRC